MFLLKKIFFLSILTLSLYSHDLRENYLQVDYNQTSDILNINLEVETRLLQEKYISSMDDNQNEIVSHKELRKYKDTLLQYIMEHFSLHSDDKQLSLEGSDIIIHWIDDQTYMQVKKSFEGVALHGLEVNYDIFLELEDTHKLLIHLNENKGDFVLSKDLRYYKFTSTAMSQFTRLGIFIKEGVVHILDGLDHLLFILMLLIPVIALKSSYLHLLKIITVFSLAHSITLFISGFGLYTPNIAFVESFIALSIVVVAALNFFKLYAHVNYKIVFFFGLMHGFGFANVLKVGQVSDTTSFLVALFGFNIGVELGQIFMILVYMIPLYFIRNYKHQEKIIKLVTLATGLVAVMWFLERIGLL